MNYLYQMQIEACNFNGNDFIFGLQFQLIDEITP